MLSYLALIWLGAGLVTGITSFGGNLFAIPLMTLFLPARDAILISCVSGMAIGLALTLIYRKGILWRDLSMLCFGFLCGMPPGVLFLKTASEKLLLLIAGSLVLLFLLWQWLASKMKSPGGRGGWRLGTAMGFLGGLMFGATGMGGPPIVFFALQRGWSKTETLCTLNALFVIFTGFLVLMQWYAGLYTVDLACKSLWGALFAGLGTLASVPIMEHVHRGLFNALLRLMIALSGIMLLARGIMA